MFFQCPYKLFTNQNFNQCVDSVENGFKVYECRKKSKSQSSYETGNLLVLGIILKGPKRSLPFVRSPVRPIP